MLKMPDFIGSFYYNHLNDSYSWRGMFGMFILERKFLSDGTESIKGTIGDTFGDSTFEGIIEKDNIIFTKKYDLDSIKNNGASEVPIYYRGIKSPIRDYVGYWTQNLDIPFDKLLPEDKIGFFLKKAAYMPMITMSDSNIEIDIRRNIRNSDLN